MDGGTGRGGREGHRARSRSRSQVGGRGRALLGHIRTHERTVWNGDHNAAGAVEERRGSWLDAGERYRTIGREKKEEGPRSENVAIWNDVVRFCS